MTIYGTPRFPLDAAVVLDAAQQVMDMHAIDSSTGRCIGCDHPGSCAAREWATDTFDRHGSLPRRVRGLSRPELIGAQRRA